MTVRKKVLSSAIVIIIIISFVPPLRVNSQEGHPFSDREHVYDLTAGFADEIHFKIINTGLADEITALQNGDIDMISDFVTDDYLPSLETNPNIETNETHRRGFGHVSFNCNKAPTSYRELRQAFAYALDKDGIQEQAFNGLSVSADSPIVPSLGMWSLDNQLWSATNNYSQSDTVTGNDILDAYGWIDIDADGWREDPFGNPVSFQILVPDVGSTVIENVTVKSVEAFNNLYINASALYMDFVTILGKVGADDFNAAIYAYTIEEEEPTFLENFMSSSFENDWNFSNTTYDALVNTMMSSGDFDTVKQACWDAQKVLWEEQPLVVTYNNLLISAYRTDNWMGHVNAEGIGTRSKWTLMKAHLKPGIGTGYEYDTWKQGGQFKISIDDDIDSTNPLITNIANNWQVLEQIYSPLTNKDPYNLEDTPWLAKDWIVEGVTGSTPRAQAGDQLKITYYLHEGLKWHDGVALTTTDVNFTYHLINETGAARYYDNVKNITHIEILNQTAIEIFTNVSGFFTFHQVSEVPILPKHIWESVSDPLTWANPNPVGSGPYKFKSRTPGSLVILQRNDDFVYNPRNYEWLGPLSVRIITPEGGKIYKESITVNWTEGIDRLGHSFTYDLYYSSDGGISWNLLAVGLKDTSYPWDLSSLPTGDLYKVKVVATCSEGLSTEDITGTFSVIGHELLPPHIQYPNGGETIAGTVTITWNESVDSWSHPVNYSVSYSDNSGSTWTSLDTDLMDNWYSWDTTTVGTGTNYLIRVTAYCSDGLTSVDISDAVFSIIKPEGVITVQNTPSVTIEEGDEPILTWTPYLHVYSGSYAPSGWKLYLGGTVIDNGTDWTNGTPISFYIITQYYSPGSMDPGTYNFTMEFKAADGSSYIYGSGTIKVQVNEAAGPASITVENAASVTVNQADDLVLTWTPHLHGDEAYIPSGWKLYLDGTMIGSSTLWTNGTPVTLDIYNLYLTDLEPGTYKFKMEFSATDGISHILGSGTITVFVNEGGETETTSSSATTAIFSTAGFEAVILVAVAISGAGFKRRKK